jgi:hypothetical protein
MGSKLLNIRRVNDVLTLRPQAVEYGLPALTLAALRPSDWRESNMNTTFKVLALALVLSAPALTFAQASKTPVSRAEVRNELIQLERAGYKPNKVKYPADIQAAEARIGAQAQSPNIASRDVGGTPSGSSQSGGARPASNWKSLYSHH